MKNLALLVSLFSVSLLANDPCENLEIRPNPTATETSVPNNCKPELDSVKNRIVIRQPGYQGNTTLEQVADHEINNRKWCDLGGHYYVLGNGTIFAGRPVTMKGANEINGKDGNTGKLGIQVLLPEGQAELSAEFVGNMTQLLACQMKKHQIAADKIRAHFYTDFHPGKLVQEFLDKFLAN